ncbi:MAG: putative quinol monooxygenase [Vicinamibacterales bacterium]
MALTRRAFIEGLAVAGALPLARDVTTQDAHPMFGLIGRMKAVSGQRDALIAILLEGTGNMPGCLSYIVARDPADADAIWVTEAWDTKASHEASLALPAVREAIRRGRPLIAAFEQSVPTEPVGGQGLE